MPTSLRRLIRAAQITKMAAERFTANPGSAEAADMLLLAHELLIAELERQAHHLADRIAILEEFVVEPPSR